MAEQIEVPAIDKLPNENGMFTEAFVLKPKSNFDHDMVVELLSALGITFDNKAFEPLSESLKKQFVVMGRDGTKTRYGSSRGTRR